MSGRVFLQLRSQTGFDRAWRHLESCPRSVADSWRPVPRSLQARHADALRLVLRAWVPCLQSAARDRWRSPRPTGHLGSAKNPAVCSGCGTRHRTVYDRTMRRVRDTDAAGWRIYLAVEQRRVACARCQGVQVERREGLAQNPC